MNKAYINRILRFFNLVLVSNKTFNQLNNLVDLRQLDINHLMPDVFTISKNPHLKILLNIPSDKIVFRAPRVLNLWVETLKLRNNEEIDLALTERASYKYFLNFYQSFQPNNVSELFTIETDNSMNERVLKYFISEPLYAVYPWEDQQPEERYKEALKTMKEEFEENSNYKYTEVDGWKGFGPVSERLILTEYKRLISINDSIKSNGYNEKFGYPRANILFDGKEYKLILRGGAHRTAAMIALNYKYIPVLFLKNRTNIIDRNNVEKWPHVISGLFSKEQALKLFDEKFHN